MSLATVVRAESKLLLPTYDRQRVLFERGRGVYLWDSTGQALPRFSERDRSECAGTCSSRDSVDVQTAGWAADSRLESVFPRVPGGAGEAADQNLRFGQSVFLQQRHRSLGRRAQTGSRLCAHPEQQWPQSQVASAGAGKFLSWPNVWLIGHDRAGKISCILLRRSCPESALSLSTTLKTSSGNLMAASAPFASRRFREKAASVRSALNFCRPRGSCATAPERC